MNWVKIIGIAYAVGFVLGTALFISMHAKAYGKEWSWGGVALSAGVGALWPIAIPLLMWWFSKSGGIL